MLGSVSIIIRRARTAFPLAGRVKIQEREKERERERGRERERLEDPFPPHLDSSSSDTRNP
jgi:hypothetical protein